jgi:hypothetical protein
MVLVSHRYRFISLKNKKVASTSIEAFFERFCMDPEKEKGHIPRHKTPGLKSRHGIIGARLKKVRYGWKPHMRALGIRKRLGKRLFRKYFKFCVVRNPWDGLVSQFFYRKHKILTEKSMGQIQGMFRRYVFATKKPYNYPIFSIRGEPICDYYIRYETLQEGLKEVCEILELPVTFPITLPRFKSNQRPARFKKNYRFFYDDEMRNHVAKVFHKEIGMFGYTF